MNILIDGQTFETPEVHRGIGIYTKSVINNMLKLNYEHNWFICVSDDTNLRELDTWVQKKLHVIKRPEVRPEINYSRNEEYTKALEELVEEKSIDLVWIPNMLMVNVLALERMLPCRVCVTVYDLIPYLFPIKEWGANIVSEYNRRLDFLAKQNVELLFISQATKEDYINHIGKAEKSAVTFLAADAKTFYKKRTKEDESSNIILFTGGFDYRKNIDGAINAFECAMKKHGEDEMFSKCKLVIVGATNAETKQKYDEIIRDKKLTDKVELTGFISEEKLGNLYKSADVFFFPSLYEGFGLPILEAMLGGGYVVSADNSSLPEVCGGHALLCGTKKVDEMAEALYSGYCNSMTESVEEKNERQEYALGYTWERTAQTTLDFWEEGELIPLKEQKDKIAILTPWPEQETGIAHYEYQKVPFLRKYYDIDIYTDAVKQKCKKYEDVGFFPIKDFKTNRHKYKHVMYQMGNNSEFHKEIFEQLVENGGVVEIHDYVMTPFFFHSYLLKGNPLPFQRAMELGYGEKGKEEFQLAEKTMRQPDMYEYPMSHSVAEYADKVLFHNHWSAEQLQNQKTGVIPLPCYETEEFAEGVVQSTVKKLKQKYDVHSEIVIGCFGWVNENKRPQVVVNAVRELIKLGYSIKLFFWGKAADNSIPNLAKSLQIHNSVFVSGYLTKEEYAAAMEMTDIVINLRYPSMGESSGTLCESFKAGKAVIVSELNQYTEFPDDVCWKVPICAQEQELLQSYLSCLIEREEVRYALGENARNYADVVLNPEKIAMQYYKFLEK